MKTNLTQKQYEKLLYEVSRELKDFPSLRYGQAFYNIIHHFYPTVLESNPDFDTFEWTDSTEVNKEVQAKLVK